jgi:hypothetical protein
MQKRWTLLLALAVTLALGAGFRFFVVHSWHAPAGDGLDFHQLSQQLLLRGTFAYGPPPLGPSYGRLPGYPLFLAYIAVRQAPLDLLSHVIKATQANVVIDLLSSCLVFGILRELGLGRRAAFGGLVATLLCPVLVLLSCYALTETLATFLGLLAFYLTLRLRRALRAGEPWIGWAALAGLAAGLGQLVRADTLTILPSLALLAVDFAGLRRDGWPAADPARLLRRLLPVGLLFAVVGLTFLPWPVRNLIQFGEPHPAGARWRTRPAGRPLPSEPVTWMRTWGDGGAGDGYLDLVFVAGLKLPTQPGRFDPKVCDDRAQCDRTLAVFTRYNQEGLTPAVRSDFLALAVERSAAHPLRTWVGLPLLRLRSLWRPLPEWELPLRAPALGFPRHRWVFAVVDVLLYALSLLGAGLLIARRSSGGGRLLALALVLPAVLRSAMYAYLIPAGINQRYLVEIYPLLIILSALGLHTLHARRTGRSAETGGVTTGSASAAGGGLGNQQAEVGAGGEGAGHVLGP